MDNENFCICNESNSLTLKKYSGNEKIVHIPDGIECIDIDAFSSCSETEDIFIPSTIKTIKKYAFSGCQNLKRIHFLGTDKIMIRAKAFDKLSSPFEIIYSGTLENWIESTQKYTEIQYSYDNGWDGGAPGVYTYLYTYYPMEHSLGEKFTYKIKCLADGQELLEKGKKESIGGTLISSPYDN